MTAFRDDERPPVYNTGIVGKLGFGVSGPHGTFLTSAKETISLVRRAHHLGIRNFDTAPSYGDGEAERRLGEGLSVVERSGCIVSTKVGLFSDGATRKRRDFSAGAVQSSVEASLRRLRCSRIDLLYLHGPAPQELSDKLLTCLAALKKSGQVGALGVCGISYELDAAVSSGEFTHYMTPVNAALGSESLARLARIRKVGTLVGIETMALTRQSMSPLRAGGLWRLVRRILRRARATKGAAMTVEEAFAWALKQGGVDLILTSTTRIQHLQRMVECSALRD